MLFQATLEITLTQSNLLPRMSLTPLKATGNDESGLLILVNRYGSWG